MARLPVGYCSIHNCEHPSFSALLSFIKLNSQHAEDHLCGLRNPVSLFLLLHKLAVVSMC